ncbi:MAG: FliI/YscN family ATPase [Pseudomonadota bacterium]
MAALAKLAEALRNYPDQQPLIQHGGVVNAMNENAIQACGLDSRVALGDLVAIGAATLGEVNQVNGREVSITPLQTGNQVRLGDPVFPVPTPDLSDVLALPGRVINALGHPIDGKPLARIPGVYEPAEGKSSSHVKEKSALGRQRIDTPLLTGIRAIDIFTPLCLGQRVGVFAGSGVGKSTLLSMLAKAGAFDVIVVALVGERNREVREFIEDAIGTENRGRTIMVVATGDESAVMRRRAPELAMNIATDLRDANKQVLLLMDSVTRYAHALREIGIARGEPVVARGYPTSVFQQLPKFLERAGMGVQGGGSITAITTVLVDGDDHNDPVADAVRGTIDGHIVLDRAIAEEGRYPPINPLSSLSRLSSHCWTAQEQALVLQLRKMIALYESTTDLRMLGGWSPGGDASLDKAVATVPLIYDALRQTPGEAHCANPFEVLVDHLKQGGLTADG